MTRVSAGVIGAGIFGVAAALELADLGVDVTLYEKRAGILSGTTDRNFFRVHRGYHYPRDPATARQAHDGYAPFMGTFAEALTPGVPSYYAIAAEGSLTTAEQFGRHCGDLGLHARPVTLPVLVPGSVSACFEADEYYYDPGLLRQCCQERLTESGVGVNLFWHGSPDAVAGAHDVVVVAAYAGLNEVLTGLGCAPRELQYEMCEVALVRAPGLDGCSVAVMDGPFCSVAPYPYRGAELHMLYDVVHSVHARATGYANPGLQPGPARLAQILASARRFLGPLDDVWYAGSLFAERVVLPGVDATDARPSEVWWAGPSVLAVLSGKVSASVTAGRAVAAEVAARFALEGANA